LSFAPAHYAIVVEQQRWGCRLDLARKAILDCLSGDGSAFEVGNRWTELPRASSPQALQEPSAADLS
jgi:hypothetical protein